MFVFRICEEPVFVLFFHGPLNELSSGIDIPTNWGKRENIIISKKIRNNSGFPKRLF